MAISKKPYTTNKTIKQDAESALEKLTKKQETPQKEEVKHILNEDGTVTVDFIEGEEEYDQDLGEYDYKQGHFANLVDMLDEDQQNKLAGQVLANFNSDDQSRSDWLRTIEMGFDLLGVKLEEKNTPFEGACSAQHPLLMESAVKFQSKASTELLPPNGPVKTKVMGDVTVEKEQQANRVKNHLNYQLTEEMTEFYPDTERMLLYVPLFGSAFKKTYYDAYLERPCSEFIPADQLVVPNSAPDLFRADRYTHIIYKTDYQMEACFADGFYLKPKDGLGVAKEAKLTVVQKKAQEIIGAKVGLGERDKVYTLYEQHVMLHIDGIDEEEDGHKLSYPYVVTIDEGSGKLIGLRRNWKESDAKRRKRVQFTHYGFVPSFNFYCFGYLHLLGNLQLTLTSSLRSLVDAGQFATLQGGFKLKGVRIIDDGSPVHPGQFKEIESIVQDVNKAIMPLPFKEPSNVLYQMLQFLDAKGQKFADATEQVIADSTNYGPVGTTMALLEASTKFFSAVHKRLHQSLKNELRIVADINSETLPDNYTYNIENQTMRITRDDYDERVDVIPCSDPNMSSSAHRMAKAQTLLEIALKTPTQHDMREVLRHVYVNMDYENVDKLLPPPQQAQQQDPMSDIQGATQGMPIKAFQGQDHKAHIAIKQAFLQDPMSGQNPMMQKASIAIQANVQEHMMLQFQEQVTAMMQQQMQQMDPAQLQKLPPEQMQQLQAQAMSQAAQQVAQLNLQNLQQQVEAAKQSPKDQATLMLAQAEWIDTKTQQKKVGLDAKLKMAELELRKEQLDLEREKEKNKLMIAGIKSKADLDKLVTTKGLDAMIKALTDSYEIKQDKDMMAMQHQQAKELEVVKARNKPKPKPTSTT